jgi:hypothetical protein
MPRGGSATKKSRLPVAVGAVVVLAVGVGGWVLLSGGDNAGGSTDTSRVAQDTARIDSVPQNRGSRTGTQTATLANRDTGGGTRNRSTIDPANAGTVLEGLIESTPAVKRDSATKVFNTPGVIAADRAFAACMIAQAELTLGNSAAALRWARRGLGINPALTSCQNVVQSAGT